MDGELTFGRFELGLFVVVWLLLLHHTVTLPPVPAVPGSVVVLSVAATTTSHGRNPPMLRTPDRWADA